MLVEKNSYKQQYKIDKQSFSFINNQYDQKQQNTVANSQQKHSQYQTDTLYTWSDKILQPNEQQHQYYSENQIQQKYIQKTSTQYYGLQIMKQITYYNPEQYKKKLQNLLNQKNLTQQNKIYLRLIVIDKQMQYDHRLETYFNWAMEQYRVLKEKNMQQNLFGNNSSAQSHFLQQLEEQQK